MSTRQCVDMTSPMFTRTRDLDKQQRERVYNMIDEKLLEFLETLASRITEDKHSLFVYKENDENGKQRWSNIYLTPDNSKKLMEQVKKDGCNDRNYAQRVEQQGFFYEQGSNVPPIHLIFAFLVCPFEACYGKGRNGKRSYTNRENAFLPYYVDDKLPPMLLEYLENRLQIISRKSDKSLLNDCCAILALRNAGVEEYTLNMIKGTRLVNDRNMKFGDLIKVCEEFNLNVSIRDCNAETTGHKNQVRMSTKYKEGNPIVLCAYKGHYFLEETTPLSLDNVRRLEINNDILGKRYRNGKWIADNSGKIW